MSKEKDVTVSVDGEPIGMLPAIFKVHHNALTIRSEAHSARIIQLGYISNGKMNKE